MHIVTVFKKRMSIYFLEEQFTSYLIFIISKERSVTPKNYKELVW